MWPFQQDIVTQEYGMYEKFNLKTKNQLYLFLYVFQKMPGVIITWSTTKNLLYPAMPQSSPAHIQHCLSLSKNSPWKSWSSSIFLFLSPLYFSPNLYFFLVFFSTYFSFSPKIYYFPTRIDFAFLNVSNLMFWTLPIDTYTISWPTLRANLMRSPKARRVGRMKGAVTIHA